VSGRWQLIRGGVLGAALAAAGACVTMPQPTPNDVERARQRWPEASLDSLNQGKHTYETRCSGCHRLYAPSTHPPDQWAKAIAEMADRAKLRPEEQRAVLQFLVTLSGRPQT
jgi:cytochrome c5